MTNYNFMVARTTQNDFTYFNKNKWKYFRMEVDEDDISIILNTTHVKWYNMDPPTNRVIAFYVYDFACVYQIDVICHYACRYDCIRKMNVVLVQGIIQKNMFFIAELPQKHTQKQGDLYINPTYFISLYAHPPPLPAPMIRFAK